jgi:hypothetical protein
MLSSGDSSFPTLPSRAVARCQGNYRYAHAFSKRNVWSVIMMWEYLIVELGHPPLVSGFKDILDKQGREGWELATIVAREPMVGIFKRAIAAEANVR